MSFYGVTDLGTYVIGAIAIILLPGPNSLFVLSLATARGTRAAYAGAMGVFLGDVILLGLTALGAVELLRSSPGFFIWIKYLGAAYLAWIGLNLLASAWRHQQQERATASALTPVGENGYFRRALLISLLNPKAILFLISFFVQFIDPAYEPRLLPFLILSIIIMSFSLMYLSALIFAGTRLTAAFSRRRRLAVALSAGVGCLFVWFGARLATASLN
jgi:leucine efflux protein